MKSEELNKAEIDQEVSKSTLAASNRIVTADSVQAEEVPTIPIESLETLSSLQPEISVHAVAPTRSISTPTPLVEQPEEYHRSFGEWIQIWTDGMRTAYLRLPLMPVLLGSVLAWTPTVTTKTPLGSFHLTRFVATLIVIILLQLGANLVNDYYDYMRGIDTSNVFGPGNLIQQGTVKPTRVLLYGLSLLALGAVLGLVVAAAGGPLVYVFGLIGLLCAYFYSATLRSLSSLGLSELIAFVVFGPLITMGAYLVQTDGHFSSTPFIYSIPLGLLAAAVILVNNVRDIEGDIYAGKHTIATVLKITWSRPVFVLFTLAAYAIIVLLGLPHKAPHFILLSLWTFPVWVVAITGMLRTDAPAGFHQVLRETLKLLTFFSIFLMIGLILTVLIPVLPVLPAHLLPF